MTLMTLQGYQVQARDTAVFHTPDDEPMIGIMYTALGLAGEAGEVADQTKKAWRNDQQITAERKEKIEDELGDVLWYAAACADQVGASLSDIAQANLEKLAARKNKGKLKEHR